MNTGGELGLGGCLEDCILSLDMTIDMPKKQNLPFTTCLGIDSSSSQNPCRSILLPLRGRVTHIYFGAADVTVKTPLITLQMGEMNRKQEKEEQESENEVQTDVSRLCRGLSGWQATICTWLQHIALLFLLAYGVTSPSNSSTLVPDVETFSRFSSSCSSRSGVRGTSSSMANSGWVMKLWMEFWFLGFWMLSWRELWNALTTLIYIRGRKRKVRKYKDENWPVKKKDWWFEERNKTYTIKHY